MARSKPHTVIVAAKRTPIGKRNGVFKNFKAHELGGMLIKSVLDFNKHPVDEVIMGNMIQVSAEPDGKVRPRPNPAQEACIHAGYGSLNARTVGRACSSALQAVIDGDRAIRSGDCLNVLAGGMESMSNFSKEFMGLVLSDPKDLTPIPMAEDFLHGFTTAQAGEYCAEICNIGRKEQDDWTIESYRRARMAQANGVFDTQIVPISGITVDEEPTLPITEEMIRTADPIPGLETITKYTAAKNADGAVILWLMNPATSRQQGLKPLAQIISHDSSQTMNNDTRLFTVEPAQAIKMALAKTGLKLSDMDILEINAPFAAVVRNAIHTLKIPEDVVNIYGDSIAFGHPVGASGAILPVRAIHALHATCSRYAMICLCHALGGALAMVIKRM